MRLVCLEEKIDQPLDEIQDEFMSHEALAIGFDKGSTTLVPNPYSRRD
jgi:hypothetical protein